MEILDTAFYYVKKYAVTAAAAVYAVLTILDPSWLAGFGALAWILLAVVDQVAQRIGEDLVELENEIINYSADLARILEEELKDADKQK